jgi:hypothetical protein
MVVTEHSEFVKSITVKIQDLNFIMIKELEKYLTLNTMKKTMELKSKR